MSNTFKTETREHLATGILVQARYPDQPTKEVVAYHYDRPDRPNMGIVVEIEELPDYTSNSPHYMVVVQTKGIAKVRVWYAANIVKGMQVGTELKKDAREWSEPDPSSEYPHSLVGTAVSDTYFKGDMEGWVDVQMCDPWVGQRPRYKPPGGIDMVARKLAENREQETRELVEKREQETRELEAQATPRDKKAKRKWWCH